jgi:hypothetical protein
MIPTTKLMNGESNASAGVRIHRSPKQTATATMVSVGRLNPATDRQVGPAGVMMFG